MVFSNYWKWQKGIQMYAKWNRASKSINLGLINEHGDSWNMACGYDNSSYIDWLSNLLLYSEYKMLLGTGDNQYEKDDYTIANDITDSFTNKTTTINMSVENGVSKRLFTYSGVNNSGSEKTITEVAYYKGIRADASIDGGEGSSNFNYCLFAICKLDNPVVVAPNDSFTIAVEWAES